MKILKRCYPALFVLISTCLQAQSDIFAEADELISGWRLEEARTKLLSYSPNPYERKRYYETLGDISGAQKEWRSALGYYKKLLALDEQSAGAHFKVAGIYGMIALQNKFRALGLIDDIKFHFKRAASLDPDHLEARWALIELYLELPGILGGSYKEAEVYAEELAEISPLEGLLARGYIEDFRKNDENARFYFLKASRFMDEVPANYPRENIHYQLGKIASRYGVNTSRGMWHLERYLKRYNPLSRIGLEWIYYHMAMISGHEQMRSKRVEYLKKAMEVAPDFKAAKEELEALKAL